MVDGGAGWDGVVYAIPFLIGIASGGQSIYAKLGGEWLQILRTLPGWLYWLSRGLVPAVCYHTFFVYRLSMQHSVPTAVLCGLGSEAVLRSQFFIRSKTTAGKTQEIYKGVFDLVEWYQSHLLLFASNSLAASRSKYMNALLGKQTDFPKLCERCRLNAASFQISHEKIRETIDKTLADFQKEKAVQDGSASTDLHRRYVFELGYALISEVGRKHLGVLFD